MAADLKWCYDIAYLIYEITERRAVTRQKKGEKTLTPSGRLENVFSGRQVGLVQEETPVVFYTRMPRETVTTSWDEAERRKEISPRARILFSIASEDTDWREKLEQSKGQSCDWKLKIPLSMVGKMKKIVVWFSNIIPYVVVTESGNRSIFGYRCLFRHANGERKPSASSKKEGAHVMRRNKRSNVVYLKNQIQRFLFYGDAGELGLNAQAGHAMKFSGCTWYKTKKSGMKRAIWRHCPKKVNLMSEILACPVLRRNTWGNLTTSRFDQQSSVEFDEKICKLRAEHKNYVSFSCEGARNTEDRMFIVDTGASMHHAEQGEWSSDTMDTLTRSKTPQATCRDREQCRWTSKHKFLFMISICS